MNPLRKRFFGDTVVAQRYTGEAMSLLLAVHDQMRLGGLEQLTMRRVMGNGVVLVASSRFGQDEVQIRHPVSSQVTQRGGREYCVWEGDEDAVTEPLRGAWNMVYGPHMVSPGLMHMGGRLDVTYFQYSVTLSGGGSVNRTNITDKDEMHAYSTSDGGMQDSMELPVVPNSTAGVESPPTSPGHVPLRTFYPDVVAKRFFGDNYLNIANPTPGQYRLIQWGDDGIEDTVVHETIALWPNGPGFPRKTNQDFMNLAYASMGPLHNLICRIPSTYMFEVSVGVSTPTQADALKVHRPTAGGSDSDVSDTAWSGGTGPEYVWAASTPTQDVLIKRGHPSGSSHTLEKVGIQTGGQEYPELPKRSGPSSQYGRAVIQNNGNTAWYISMDEEGFDLYRSDGGDWLQIDVPDGFGSFTKATYQNVNPTVSKNKGASRNVLHDPVTDAVAVVKADLTGAWIFNAKDCMNVGIPPFYREFKNVPMDLADVEGVANNYRYALPVQFYAGRLTVLFAEYLEKTTDNVGGNETVFMNYTGACYKIGKILQKKQTVVE